MLIGAAEYVGGKEIIQRVQLPVSGDNLLEQSESSSIKSVKNYVLTNTEVEAKYEIGCNQ